VPAYPGCPGKDAVKQVSVYDYFYLLTDTDAGIQDAASLHLGACQWTE